ncbi:putative translation initiation factor IF2/IF5 [Helianthus annuus]|nr:putative translation initiation factor IF2/IF5 [Helianthus annuus]KAJ0543748.1 putative translation initiation factor IF2/IF5 [Helianthus annuus]KAJ0708802.1 putative translation initiation factor IF2/IF5 [Helianthus annuus]KAJ0712713.1 putative translation initiation factor IF2/IF5 [Helianthus annuus]KAJ0889875.1 putative translation initiation factor IF2/IF5 [Helianthus annuus]
MVIWEGETLVEVEVEVWIHKKLQVSDEEFSKAVYGIQLLGRVFRIIHEHNPELAGDRRRTVFRPPLPQVLREGTQKIVFVNFMDLCKSML